MLEDIALTLWLFLPAGVANMAPVFAAHWGIWSRLDRSIDAGKTWRGRRLFGDHKTIRGFVAGWLSAIIFVFIQIWLYQHWSDLRSLSLTVLNYDHLNPLAWGSALALGALSGDAIKSFFKRQLDFAPGRSWVPFDQIDYVAGTLLSSLLVLRLPLRFYVIAVLLGLALHPLGTFIGWLLKLKDEPI